MNRLTLPAYAFIAILVVSVIYGIVDYLRWII